MVSPTNNAFANALPLTGNLASLTNQSLRLATAEEGESSHGGTTPYRTVWYRWIAPHFGEADLNINCSVQLGIGIYQGTSLSNLVPVPQTFTTTNYVRWMANPGDEFVFAVNEPSAQFITSGTAFNLRLVHGSIALVAPFERVGKVGFPITLQFEQRDTNSTITRLDVSAGSNLIGSITNFSSNLVWIPETGGTFELTAVAQTSIGDTRRLVPQTFSIAPGNDFFDEAYSLPSILTNYTAHFSTANSTLEPGEPIYGNLNPPFTGSLWWKWQPQHTTVTEYSATDNHLFIFEGESLEHLTPLNPLQIVPLIIRAWNGYGSSSIPPLPATARFTNYAGKTYWFAAASTAITNASWAVAQRLHWLSAANGHSEAYAQNPFTVVISGVSGLTPPSNIHIRALKYVFNGSYWTPIQTDEGTFINTADLSWSWVPQEPGEYDLRANGQYPSGESWQHAIRISVREANDSLETAPLLVGVTNLNFSTAHATVDPDEPPFGTNIPPHTVWWRWRTETNTNVRIAAPEVSGGLPIDIFVEVNGILQRIAHNEGRTMMPPLQGWVPLQAQTGVEYLIRASNPLPTVRAHVLSIENIDAPMPGLVFLTTVLGQSGPSGHIHWQTYARVLLADGTPATNFNYRAQFYAGETHDRLRPISPAVFITPIPWRGEPGGVSAGFTNTPVWAGNKFWIQLRAWDANLGSSYESARANGGLLGRSPILEVVAGSELVGPTVLTNLSDIRLATTVNNFTPGELLPDGRSEEGAPRFELRAPAGFLYSVDVSTNTTSWAPLLVLTNTTGYVKFAEPRNDPPSATFYRTRIID